MKSLDVIKKITPMLATIQGAGVFSNPVAASVKNWNEQIFAAASEDRIDLSDLIETMDALGAAEDFHQQQDEIAAALGLMETLLDDIPAGKMPEYVPPRDGYVQIRSKLSDNIRVALDQFRPSSDMLEAMRRQAAEFVGLVQGAVNDGDLPAGSDAQAQRVHYLIEELGDAEYVMRINMLEQASVAIGKIAA